MNATTLLAYFSHIQKESGGANENSHLHRASACAEGPRLSLAFAALRFVSFRFVSPKSVQCEPVGEEFFLRFLTPKNHQCEWTVTLTILTHRFTAEIARGLYMRST